MKIKPFGDRIVVRIIEESLKVSSKIVLLDEGEDKGYQIGEITAISDSEQVIKNFQLSDKVIFLKGKGVNIEDEVILNIDDILGSLVEKNYI